MATTKPKLNRADYMFADKTGEELIKKPGEVNGLDFAIRDLKDCTVFLLDHTAQILVDDCENTTMVIGPVKGSIFFRNCTNCKISVACQQFRCRDLKDCTINLYVANEPVIESSQNLTFGPYNAGYPFLDQHVQAVGFDINDNKWQLVFDFTKDESGQKRNFNLLDPSQFEIVTKSVEGVDQKPVIVFPYPQRYGGTQSDEANAHAAQSDHGMMEHGIEQMKRDAEELARLKAQGAQGVPVTIPQYDTEPQITEFHGNTHANNSHQNNDDDFDLFQAAGSNSNTNAANNYQAPSMDMGGFNNDLFGSTSQQPPAQKSQEFANNGSQMNWQQDAFQNNNLMGSQFQSRSQEFSQPGMYQQPQMQMNFQMEDGEDLDDEERERVMQAELHKQDQMRQLYLKQEDESRDKQQKKQQGRDTLQKWQQERTQQIAQRIKTNKQMEEDYHSELKRLKETTNPWERVIQNVEINSQQYVGASDVSRMRQAMISRKQDITKSGGMKKSAF